MSNDKLESLAELFTHWDSNYWYTVYLFLVIQSAFIVAYTEIFTSIDLEHRNIILFGLSSLGLLISILWIFILNRKICYTHSAENLIFNEIPALKEEIDRIQSAKWFRMIPASIIAQNVFPLIFSVWWIITLFLNPEIYSILIILIIILIPLIFYIIFGTIRSKEHNQ